MADDNITSLTINIMLIVVCMIGMLSGYLLLVNNEGRGEIFDPYPEISSFNYNLTSVANSTLLDRSNLNANLTTAYNPELAISGADQSGNAIAGNNRQLAQQGLIALSVFGTLIFGNLWTTIIWGILLGLFSSLMTYYFIKWIRTGQ